jgi:ribosomal protein S18 acetylase RimI-like enzyme
MMVKLTPMTENEFKTYLEADIKVYAEVNVRSGYWNESEALEKSRESHDQLLPDGLATKDQYLFMVIDETSGEVIGNLWLEIKPDRPTPAAFIYDIKINQGLRRQGYGEQALHAAESLLRSMNIKTLSLHVFADNTAAKRLYEKVGFETISYNMRKEL